MEEYDVLIVGSGSTGGALAGRLTSMSDRKVLVLEGGPVYRSIAEMPDRLLLPGNIGGAAPGNPNNWAYPAELVPGLNLPYARGKGLGGSSSINGCYWIRAIQDDFNTWTKAGNPGWTYDDVLPYYKRGESDLDYPEESAHHGSEGPVSVRREPSDRAPEFTQAFVESCLDLGYKEDPDKNAPSDGGVGPVPMNVRDGKRIGSALAYLIPALNRPNLTIVGDAIVQRVIFDGNRAVGVEALVAGRPTTFRAGEIVVSAGSLRSPQILMVSGVGAADHLRAHGIEVVADVPGVGQNLSDHPMVSASWNSRLDLPKVIDRGPLTSALHWRADGSEMEVLPFVIKNGDMLGVSDVMERPVAALKAMRGTSPKAVIRQARNLSYAMLGIVVFQEESRGSVTLSSADPSVPAVLKWNLLAEETDRVRFRTAVRVAHEIFQSSSLRALGAEIVGLDASDLRSDKDLDKWVSSRIGAGHPSCTCKMGPDSDPLAVVDHEMRVRGVENLRVADTSVFPTIPSRGPNATAMMLGERLADMLA